MAEGFLKSFDTTLEIVSAGTEPGEHVHPFAIRTMKEVKIDISNNYPKTVNDFLSEEFDYVITVCGGAKENCPVFTGMVKNQIHIGFDDPTETSGTDEKIIKEFRRIRNEIEHDFKKLYFEKLITRL